MGDADKSIPPLPEPARPTKSCRRGHGFLAATGILFLVWSSIWLCLGHRILRRTDSTPRIEQVQQCAIDNLHANLSFLDSAKPIEAAEFVERRDRLAEALYAGGVDAFALEPGYAFQYYGNTSQTDWEPWEPEERPFIMLILPEKSSSGQVAAKTAFLAPHFEEGRVRMLSIPSKNNDELDIVVWEEHWNPYDTLIDSRLFGGSSNKGGKPKIMIEEEMRDFIVRGLDGAGFETVGMSAAAERVRQLKSGAEVELIRAVNTGTVVAVRAMRPCLVAGLTEDEVTDILNNALLSVGFKLFFNIVLFEEHGALPHGGFVTGWKKLTQETMVVIDVGAHYLGYSSDVCRSFVINPPPSAECWGNKLWKMLGLPGSSANKGLETRAGQIDEEKVKVWNIVLDAQTAGAGALKPDNTAASVDIAGRRVIEDAGYGPAFTHRIGHGIGIKAHESPYLNKWNKEARLEPGMTFTNEPGIYLEGRFGVRHEDVYVVRGGGGAELLTGQRARGPYEP